MGWGDYCIDVGALELDTVGAAMNTIIYPSLEVTGHPVLLQGRGASRPPELGGNPNVIKDLCAHDETLGPCKHQSVKRTAANSIGR